MRQKYPVSPVPTGNAWQKELPAIFERRNFRSTKGKLSNMSSLSVFPPPPAEGEITLCEFNARLISEDSKTAKLSKYVPATQVIMWNGFAGYCCSVRVHKGFVIVFILFLRYCVGIVYYLVFCFCPFVPVRYSTTEQTT